MKKIILMGLCFLIFLAGCTSGLQGNTEPEDVTADSLTNTEPELSESQSTSEIQTEVLPTKTEVQSLLYSDFNDMRKVYGYEPGYDATQWMNEEGALLFPYESDWKDASKVAEVLGLLYMPEEVLSKAATEDLLKVVMEGWLESNVTSISVYSTPSDYILSCTIKNQAANELMARSDMVVLLYEDYCSRSYLEGGASREGRWAADKLQFDEIILASNYAFAQMDDEMKENVLKEALRKQKQVESGTYYTVGHTSGFFAYIAEEERKEGSNWYQYICDNKIEAAKNAICFDELSWLEQ